MKISLVEVAALNFHTDEKCDQLNTKFLERLGMRRRYLPARLAIAKSLAISKQPDIPENASYTGKPIKGDTLFGTGVSLSVWISLIVERSGETSIDNKRLKAIVGAHWQRGIEILDKKWLESDQDITKFLKRLIDEAELPMKESNTENLEGKMGNIIEVSGKIEVPIGEVSEDVDSGESVSWLLNGPGGSPHCAIMGGVGSGKTRTAVAMLKSIRSQVDVPILAFDFKGDLADPKGHFHMDEIYSAKVIEPPRTPVPLDVLALNSKDEFSIAEAAMHFRDTFSRLKSSKLGNNQKSAIIDAASSALEKYDVCKLSNIKDELMKIYEDNEFKQDGATATMQELTRFPYFVPNLSPSDFFQKSWIIKMTQSAAEENRIIVVNLILNALDKYLNSLDDSNFDSEGSRNLRIICMVDEAHQILNTKLPSLSRLIRMSRSKGGAIMLISQSPDDFSGVDDEFLSEMGLVAAFSTNAPPKNAARILGKGAKLGNLQTGQCILKKRGDQNSKRIVSWKSGE